jgi:hypothetical protein
LLSAGHQLVSAADWPFFDGDAVVNVEDLAANGKDRHGSAVTALLDLR